MQLSITARHFDLTKAIREHVEDAVEKLDRYFSHINNMHLTLALENGRNIVEMTLHASHFNLQSQAESHDMYLAIDMAIERMEAQIKKLKDKVTHHQKKVSRAERQYAYANLVQRGGEHPKKTVKTKRIIAEAMTIADAMDKFEEISESYYIFRNIETDRVNVLVKKDDLHFKLIEP